MKVFTQLVLFSPMHITELDDLGCSFIGVEDLDGHPVYADGGYTG